MRPAVHHMPTALSEGLVWKNRASMKTNSLLRVPIRYKLNFLALVTTGVALSVAFFALRFSTRGQFEKSLKLELLSLARVIGQAAEASIMFNDQGSAQRFLDALSGKPNIVSAKIVTAQNTVLATYVRKGIDESLIPSLSETPGVTCGSVTCQATMPIDADGSSAVGTIVVVSDLSALQGQLRENAIGLGWTFLVSFAVALILANLIQGIISRPLLQLVDLARHVSIRQDYSLRVATDGTIGSQDEIGTLVRGVNYMLEQIQRRDEELTAAKDIAEKASQAKSEFVANTSHEIRTPINNIIGFTEMLAENPLEKEEKRLVRLIHASAESLLSIINDILDISKIEAGRMELDYAPTDLQQYLRNMLGPLEEHAKGKDLEFHLRIDENLPPRLDVDAVRLGQVMMNLVNNAIKFTPAPGTIRVDISVLERNDLEAKLRFTVSDTGIGVPDSAKETIFEAFRQADSSTTRQFGGTGLGLAISQRIVMMMGGQIELHSEVGNGAQFTFVLAVRLSGAALSPDTIQNLAEGGSGTRPVPAMARNRNDFRVLVVEDNAMSREITVHRLKKLGVFVVIAESGEQAIEAARHSELDLILMDCQMPGMDGFETTAHIRAVQTAQGLRTPIVALTAHAMEGYREVCLNAGMDDFLTKPLHESELVDFLKKLPGAMRIFGPKTSEI